MVEHLADKLVHSLTSHSHGKEDVLNWKRLSGITQWHNKFECGPAMHPVNDIWGQSCNPSTAWVSIHEHLLKWKCVNHTDWEKKTVKQHACYHLILLKKIYAHWKMKKDMHKLLTIIKPVVVKELLKKELYLFYIYLAKRVLRIAFFVSYLNGLNY